MNTNSQHADTFDPETYREQVEEAAAHVRSEHDHKATVGLILGTGLGQLADDMDVEQAISYHDIPHFPEATVEQHEGKLLLGRLDGVSVTAMQGRFHLYEGYSPKQVTFPVRVLATLGVETLLISNAAGGMNPHHEKGELMLITDHINLQGRNPLTGPNIDEWGPRFPDMSEPYDVELRELAEEQALEHGIKLHEGVYLAVIGPNMETKAEYRFMRRIGGDVVGMSTVPEVIVARHMDLRCMAITVITDECFPDALEPIDVEDVMAAAADAQPDLTRITRGVVREIGEPVVA